MNQATCCSAGHYTHWSAIHCKALRLEAWLIFFVQRLHREVASLHTAYQGLGAKLSKKAVRNSQGLSKSIHLESALQVLLWSSVRFEFSWAQQFEFFSHAGDPASHWECNECPCCGGCIDITAALHGCCHKSWDSFAFVHHTGLQGSISKAQELEALHRAWDCVAWWHKADISKSNQAVESLKPCSQWYLALQSEN